MATGVAGIRNIVDDTPDEKFYFSYHHSAGDSMSILDADELDDNVVAFAQLFYIIADMDDRFPAAPEIDVEAILRKRVNK